MHQAHVTNFDEWRATARNLLSMEIAPEQVHWDAGAQISLWAEAEDAVVGDSAPSSPCASRRTKPQLRVPAQFISLARAASCFIDAKVPAEKWSLLYSLLWRLVRYDRRTLSLTTDPQVQCLNRMARAVSRDCHKMKAFVRFQRVCTRGTPANSDAFFTAWFEPDHAIVERVAPFFAKRFAGMSWSILTPYGCAHWNQRVLSLSTGVPRPPAVSDEYELFWQTYYCHIFNPARLKEQAMQSEMPKKYWRYLPESVCIKPLASGAAASTQQMLDADRTDPLRVRSRSSRVREAQDTLRAQNRQ
ncbi:TIGR03915 family putative DNA repair protein [Arenicella chitinivorans]|nr:TIGR03915 family putative DNA repair protein [Arenicella chitinivorans]